MVTFQVCLVIILTFLSFPFPPHHLQSVLQVSVLNSFRWSLLKDTKKICVILFSLLESL